MDRTSTIHRFRQAFTLVEVILALAIASLLAVSVFAMITASMQSADVLAREALRERREDALQRLLREAFHNFPVGGTLLLMETSTGEKRLCLLNAPGGLGFAVDGELDGGWALEAPIQANGTRTLTLMLLPPRTLPANLENAIAEGVWIPLIPGIDELRWQFRDGQTQEWKDEWPEGGGRPDLIALHLAFSDGSASLESFFHVPSLAAAPQSVLPPSFVPPPATTPPTAPTLPPPGNAPSIPSVPQIPAPPSLP